ncbi:ABC transporter permease subunit [Radicibacter daui]|uniref:ABC transporter permease subunit n=1 Tax=Radicibacter daui TaxID=3064829 RepID=UPI004046C3F7
MAVDFSFLLNESGFDVNESLIPYSSKDTYLAALTVGLLNTLHLTVVCVICASAIGLAIEWIRHSEIKLLRLYCRLYIDSMRNLPKLLILLAIYVLLVMDLPVARNALSFFDVAYLSNRGLNLPALTLHKPHIDDPALATSAALYSGAVLFFWFLLRHCLVSRFLRLALPVCLLVAGLAFITGMIRVDLPRFSGFNFRGGSAISLQFFSLAVALSLYHGAQIAEVVRAGFKAVPNGQDEAGRALGLGRLQIFWLVVLPQALRVMIPPLTNQYLNLLKNTSIGLAVGYSDLVSVMNTSINQTFRPVELMLVTMSVYLVVGILASACLNVFNRRMQLKGGQG